jgi:hypothetical protein
MYRPRRPPHALDALSELWMKACQLALEQQGTVVEAVGLYFLDSNEALSAHFAARELRQAQSELANIVDRIEAASRVDA